MAKKNIREFIKEISEENSIIESKPIIIPKKDKRKKYKRKRKKKIRQETGFICDDFEILI